MKICPRCKEWRTKVQITVFSPICKRCVRELDTVAKGGNSDRPNLHVRHYGLPSK